VMPTSGLPSGSQPFGTTYLDKDANSSLGILYISNGQGGWCKFQGV
jgi:hypothetical protein